MDGPESLDDELEIPGFPKSAKVEGFAVNLQGHLEKLSANAKSIHHVLAALCGGLDRLEKKIDTNSSQMEARLANIVHHMTGEADEDTMSAWDSLGGVGSPAELGSSLARRRSSLGSQMASFAEAPNLDLDDELSAGISIGTVVDQLSDKRLQQDNASVPRVGELEGGGSTRPHGDDTDVVRGNVDEGVSAAGVELGDNSRVDDMVHVAADRTTVVGDKLVQDGIVVAAKTDIAYTAVGDGSLEEGNGRTAATPSNGEDKTTDDKSRMEAVGEPQQTPAASSPRRRSNQDDQSDGLGSDKFNSSGGDASVSRLDSPTNESITEANQPDKPRAFELPAESITSGGSDARYIARQRWVWAFGRVCQLIRRRKRKQFEIMSQRATDKAVRMGSRVSIVEKRLDETHDTLLMVDRLRDKASAHASDIKKLNQKVEKLWPLLGMEERARELVQAMQARIEGVVRSGQKDLEKKIKSGHDELETRLEGEMKDHRARLDDMDDRYAMSEETLRHAGERLGEVQEEVATVSHSIIEVERQLRVDQQRLDSLETLKKAHQRRLSELRVKMEGVTAGGVTLEPEQEETGAERMARLLKAAGTASEFLATDLGKVVDRAATTTKTTGPADDEGPAAELHGDDGTIEKLGKISVDAAEYSRLCSSGWGDDEATGHRVAAERAEALCVRIEDVLNYRGDEAYSGERQVSSPADSVTSNNHSILVGDILCPNGRRDLPAKLAAARDTLLQVVGERTSVGGLKVDLLGLRADIAASLKQAKGVDRLESQWRDLHGHVSGLDDSLAFVKESLYDRGIREYESSGREGGQRVDAQGLDGRFSLKADTSWVQRELQRLWTALDSRTMEGVATSSLSQAGGEEAAEPSRPRPALLQSHPKQNPETAGEEADVSFPAPARMISGSLPSSGMIMSGVVGDPGTGSGTNTDHHRRSSFNEGSALIKDLLRKTSRLEQQMASKADNDEVTRALTSVGNKLRKIALGIPMIEEALSNKIERKDLTRLASLISNSGGGGGGGAPFGGREGGTGDENESNPAVLASRLNSKFRCLSCDRPLPALGPPGPPKLGATGLSIAGAGAPRSPHKAPKLRLTTTGDPGSSSRPSSPAATPLSSRDDIGDVAGWGGSSKDTATTAADELLKSSIGNLYDGAGAKDAGRRRRVGGGSVNAGGAPVDPPVRLEPIGANAPGEQIAGVLSRYPRMMPPPSRIRTAAGGGIGSRPGSARG